MARRFDSSLLDKFERTASGGLRIPARPTSVGVFVYLEADGSERREFRSPDEVFSEASLASLHGAPVTDLHPAEPVTPANWKTLAIGHVADHADKAGIYVSTDLLIQDQNAIAMIEAGARKELSCGYECDVEKVSGFFNGEPYDSVQRNIRYNHVGIGPEGWGRQGSSVCLRLDAGDAMQKQFSANERQEQMKVRIDGIEYDVGSTGHIQALERQRTNAEAEATRERARADSAEGKAAANTKSLEDATKALAEATDPARVDARARARADALDKARTIYRAKGKRFSADSFAKDSDIEILCKIAKVASPKFSADGKSDDYIRGYVDNLRIDKKAKDKDEDEEKEDEFDPEDLEEDEDEEEKEDEDEEEKEDEEEEEEEEKKDKRKGKKRGDGIYSARVGNGRTDSRGSRIDSAYNKQRENNRKAATRPLLHSKKG